MWRPACCSVRKPKPPKGRERGRLIAKDVSVGLLRQSSPCINAIVPIVKNNVIYLVKVVCMHGGLCLSSLRDSYHRLKNIYIYNENCIPSLADTLLFS